MFYSLLKGFIKDAMGDYRVGFYFMGTCMVIGSMLINFESCAKRQVNRKRENTNFQKKIPV